MTGLSASPRLIKGAPVGVDPMNPVASVVAFQCNPDGMGRMPAQPRRGGGDGDFAPGRHRGEPRP